MELQLNTQKAQQALKQIEASLGSLQAAFTKFKPGANIDASLASLSRFKGPSPQAAASIDKLSQSLDKISRTNNFSQLSSSLDRLARTDVSAAARGVQALSTALSGIRVPPSLNQVSAALNNIARSAPGAVTGLNQAAQAANNFNRSASAAHRSTVGFGGVLNSVRGAAAGFGVVLGSVGFARFISGAAEAFTSIQAFDAILTATTSDAKLAASELEFVRKTTNELAVPVQAAMKSYAKLSAAMIGAGKEVEDVHKIFRSFSTVFRVLNASQDQVSRGFLAIEQMYSKGVISMEELRRQLGEIFPAFALLAEGMKISTKELSKLIETGKVDPAMISKLADAAIERYGKGLPKALESAQASMTLLGNAFFWIQAKFGEGFLIGLQPAINELTKTLSSEDVLAAAKNWGELAGVLAGALTYAVNFVIKNWEWLKIVIGSLLVLKVADIVTGWGRSFLGFGTILAGLVPNLAAVFSGVGTLVRGFIGLFLSVNPIVAAVVIGVGVALWGLYTVFTSVFGGMRTEMNNWVGAFQYGFAALGEAIMSVVQPIINFATLVASYIIKPFEWIGQAIDWVSASFWSFADTIGAWTQGVSVAEFQANVAANALTNMANSSDMVALSAAKGVPAVEELRTSTGQLAANGAVVATSSDKAATSIASFATTAENAHEATTRAATATGVFAANATTAASSATTMDAQTRNAASSVGNLASNLSSSAASADNAAAAYRRAAAAARDLAMARAQAGQGGGSDHTESVDSYAGGGIAGRGNGRSVSVPASAFMSATAFATGGTTNGLAQTLPGGGIPAVLHGNEAVVPLTGGGAIPIAMTGGAPQGAAPQGGQSSLDKAFRDQLYALRDIHLDVVRTWESIDTQSVLIIEGFDATNTNLNEIANRISTTNGKLTELIGKINTMAQQRAAASSGGGGGGSGSLSGFDANGKYNPHNLPAGSKMMNKGGMGIGTSGGRKNETGSGWFGVGVPYGFNTSTDTWGFATGSPNASKDMRGGFQATLHPDEAVIPLPDGRSVPVTMSDSLNKTIDIISAQLNALANRSSIEIDDAFIDRSKRQMTAMERGIRSKTGDRKHTGAPSIVVQMTVNTPDASSFRASQNQILQDLQSKLEKTARTYGNNRVIDDPTRKHGTV